eukprot:CAMPEP_0203788092 /NCGR_PEP_ID=MMETSP0100_2-20121128/2636_1 /ASSEMBLY_ACC=CAM_ASM_000210 /TAXON_ID=96639 /ORGANISM=" , Strain NY0313808BC1" /LENGTH=300 /DNA_ID=CAMNT_0050690759 /DNA_START=208 /DNA_END=1110 /DNA_ORIENTATION=-
MSSRYHGLAGARAERLADSVKNGDAYSALQTYKTFQARLLKKDKYDEAIDLLRSGSIVLLEHQDLTAGTELSQMLVETLEAGKVEQNDDVMNVIEEVNAAFMKVDAKEEAVKNQCRFLKACITWSYLKNFGRYEKGDPRLHLLAAQAKIRINDATGASANFLHSHRPDLFAEFLVNVSTMGYVREKDLFLARGVLQLLALENLKDAVVLHDTFLDIINKQGQKMPDTPLYHFTTFLLKTVERDAYPLFKMLCEKYSTTINRDPTFPMYIDRISEVFFGVKPQKKGLQAMMDNMLGMFGGK